MTTTQHMKLNFRRCWINKTNNLKSNISDYSVLNIEDCPIVTVKDGTITGIGDNGTDGVIFASANHGFVNGQSITIADTTYYNGTWVVSLCTTSTFNVLDVMCPYNPLEPTPIAGTWAGSFDVSDASQQVKITIKNSLLKDADFSQSYTSETSYITGCKLSKVVFGQSRIMDCEEITGSSYLAFIDDVVCENVTSIHLTPISGTDLYYLGGSIENSLVLNRFNDNRITLSNTTLYGNVDLDSDANIGIQVLNSFVVGRMSMASAGISSASAIIAKNSAIGDVIATGGGLIDFSNTKCGSMTGSDTATVKLKTCEIETDLTMGAGTTLEKKNSHVGGLTLIDNGVAVSYGDAEKAMKIAQLIMTGN